MDAVQKANSGHPGTPMALAPLAYTIFTRFLRHNPENPQWPDRDRFILSAGHASMLQYALLHLTGYDLTLDDLKNFRQWESRTPGHPEHFLTPGVETTTGPLGQGFATGVGMAMAERFLAGRYNRIGHEVMNHHVYCICSDGDLMEGVANEAASIAGQNALGKLVYVYDDNRITIDGTTALSFDREDKAKRFDALGWHVQHVDDVEDLEALEEAIREARDEEERPSLVIVRSHIAYPAPNAIDTSAAHGAALGEDEVRAAKEAMGLDPDEHFAVPDEVYEHMDQKSRGRDLEGEWNARFRTWQSEFPELAEEWDYAWKGKPLPGYQEALPVWDASETEKLATRKAGAAVMNAFKGYAPTMIGGAADLVASTSTAFEGGGMFSPDHPGRNIAFGVREHGMGSAVNGMAVHGGMVRPYGSTFLIFSDYMRPAVRLSALMGIPAAWVFTHDSVALGEDGPTHQPVEHFMALRAIPNLTVIRPADANETSMAWRSTLEADGPVALLLTRQNVPVVDRSKFAPAEGALRGAYVLAEALGGADEPDAILVASGSEVAVALEARELLTGQGVNARVVSMPSWEIYDAQDQAYKDSVLPPSVEVRVSVEAGVPNGWERYVGFRGASIGIDRFGASAPGETVLEKLGITPENAANAVLALLGRGERVSEDEGTPAVEGTDPSEGHS
ncbi:transketolase [Rubrobacter marinus]|uniref:Transketolase n=2 Tax=Rubrobacter marinus TaxID=2653852 RepID=A0A6G8Q3P1_9ACTN|nr:transketolase [Rubrobacter marinus]